jgi:2-dehydro-3-deoxygalactonokinase
LRVVAADFSKTKAFFIVEAPADNEDMPISTTHPFIGVDWGTSSFRAALIAPDGEILDELALPKGITHFKSGEFAPFLVSTCAKMMKAGGQSFLLSGMVGSRDGMTEVAYKPCPVTPADLARGVKWAVPDRVAIAPGVRFENEDVMRGEEIQVFGAASVLGIRDAFIVLPGTHSKWVNLQDGVIRGFNTFMTGEFFALLSKQSILAKSMPQTAPRVDIPEGSPSPYSGTAPLQSDAFLRGVDMACQSESLLNTAFSVRVKSLMGELSPEQALSYLSGLVIGEELAAMQVQPGAPLIVVGAQQLTERYRIALEHLGAQVRTLGQQASWAGLRRVYLALAQLR